VQEQSAEREAARAASIGPGPHGLEMNRYPVSSVNVGLRAGPGKLRLGLERQQRGELTERSADPRAELALTELVADPAASRTGELAENVGDGARRRERRRRLERQQRGELTEGVADLRAALALTELVAGPAASRTGELAKNVGDGSLRRELRRRLERQQRGEL